jgi:hypothetical protein
MLFRLLALAVVLASFLGVDAMPSLLRREQRGAKPSVLTISGHGHISGVGSSTYTELPGKEAPYDSCGGYEEWVKEAAPQAAGATMPTADLCKVKCSNSKQCTGFTFSTQDVDGQYGCYFVSQPLKDDCEKKPAIPDHGMHVSLFKRVLEPEPDHKEDHVAAIMISNQTQRPPPGHNASVTMISNQTQQPPPGGDDQNITDDEETEVEVPVETWTANKAKVGTKVTDERETEVEASEVKAKVGEGVPQGEGEGEGEGE